MLAAGLPAVTNCGHKGQFCLIVVLFVKPCSCPARARPIQRLRRSSESCRSVARGRDTHQVQASGHLPLRDHGYGCDMAMAKYGYSCSRSCGCSCEGQFLLIVCFVLNLAHTVPALSNANAAAAKAVAVVMASLAMAVLAYVYVACVVPDFVIGLLVFVAM